MPSFQSLVVHQWLSEWNDVNFEPVPPRGKPKPVFYLFTISAYDLRRLSGIYRRDPAVPPAEDIGVQRRHQPDRSDEILRYLRDGFPLSRINRKRLVSESEVPSLRMPGWLPTAIIANFLVDTDERGPNKARVPAADLVKVVSSKDGASAEIRIPDRCLSPNWRPVVHPIEIIDGQHRLWALEESEARRGGVWSDKMRDELRSIQIPVVAFHGLDRAWQAYLFYTINQLPKKVDSSLVYDLYPLLRDQEWLERVEGPEVYRTSRAQDLTILLWSHPDSPWKDRILRHGGRQRGQVTQASFIRSLLTSYIRTFVPPPRIGGLFGAHRRTHDAPLDWSREQQAAFLIMIWREMEKAVIRTKSPWAERLKRRSASTLGKANAAIAFSGPDSLLASDMGCRAVLSITNDVFLMLYHQGRCSLDNYLWSRDPDDEDDNHAVTSALKILDRRLPEAVTVASAIADTLAAFDWRSSSAVSRDEGAIFDRQASFRGSGGYRALRGYVLEHLRDNSRDKSVRSVASEIMSLQGFEEAED